MLSTYTLKAKRYLRCGLIWACLAKNWISVRKALQQTSRIVLVMALWTTRRDRDFCLRRPLDLQTLPARRAEAHHDHRCILKKLSLYSPPKAVSGPSPTHTLTCTHICLCPWFILKVLPRAFLQQHALIGGSDQKKGGINQQSGIMPFVNFCKFLLLHQTEKLKGKPRGN